jgi:lambda family phage portal protein
MKKLEVGENWIDRAIGYVAPVHGARRLMARQNMAVANAYIGASKSRRQTNNWNPATGDADAALNPDLLTLRDRSMDLYRNTPLAIGAINTNRTSVIGSGLKLESQIDRRVLNLSDDQTEAWEDRAEMEFRLWAESGECDIARGMSFGDIMDVCFTTMMLKGDIFVNMPMIKRTGSPYDLKLQMIDPDRVCNKDFAPDTLELSAGVEKDKNGAPTYYHILNTHPDRYDSKKSRKWTRAQVFGQLTGRRRILHLVKHTLPNQTRGIPYLAPVIETFKMLDRYTEAEVMAAVISGMFTVFIKSESGDTDLNPMSPVGETGGKTTDEDYKLAAGAMVGLGPNESIETANPGRPNTAFDPFVQAVLRQVGVALELPMELLIKHFTSSYSASRAALLEAWRFFASRRQTFARKFCQPVYENWMEEAVLKGRIHAPGFMDDPIIRRAYLGAKWVGPAKGQIDEKKEVEAAKLRIDSGFSTYAEVTSEINGGDHRQNVARIKREKETMRQAGMVEEDKPTIPGADAFNAITELEPDQIEGLENENT